MVVDLSTVAASTVSDPGRWQSRVGASLTGHRGSRFGALDGCRAVAAGAVVLYHIAQPVGLLRPQDGVNPVEALLNNLGNFGVAVFFLLSGFLLYRPYVSAAFSDRRTPDPVQFLRRRAVRIFPGYWLALSAFIVLIGVKNPSSQKYATLYLLVQNYRPAHAQVGLHVAWTLVIEVSFYVALPFIAWLIGDVVGRGARSRRAKAQAQLLGLGLMVVTCLAYRCTIGVQSDAFDMTHLWLPNYLDWFALGMLLAVAVAWVDAGRALPRAVTALAGNTVACWALAGWCYVVLSFVRVEAGTGAAGGARETATDMVVRFFFNGLGAFFLLLPIVLGGRVADRLRQSLDTTSVAMAGAVSYGIYLWHTIWIKVLAEALWDSTLPADPSFASILVFVSGVVVATTVAATLSFLLVEQPALRFKDSRRRAGSRAA